MLDWLAELPHTNPVAHALGLTALVCALGMALGSIKFKGIGLGSAGVLLVGIFAAKASQPMEPNTLTFIREFGLTLFVFAIGLQLGPGFFASLRADGLRLNLLAAALVLVSGGVAPLVGWLAGVEREAIAGLFAGASTNTPALGAAQQSLAAMPEMDPQRLALPALACAVTYPAAIAALLGTLVALKICFRIDPAGEAHCYSEERRKRIEPLVRRSLVVETPELEGISIGELYSRCGEGIAVSRIRPAGESEVQTALRSTKLSLGDVLLAVGPQRLLDPFERFVGRPSHDDLMTAPGRITFAKIVVTHRRALGRSPDELGLESIFGVEVTRITRGDVEMTAVPNLRLQFGDVLQVVGTPEQLQQAAKVLGNSLKKLNETQFVPLFAGIWLGVLVGSIPWAIPGLPHAVRLGLAGGPLIVALALARIGHIGGMVWHMPINANHAFREFGVALFFAALGLAAGDHFFAIVFSSHGLLWLALGLTITLVPLIAIALWCRLVEKMNFVTLSGLLAGGMTNPPALSFATNLCQSDAPSLAYATVYPLTTLLRILVAQILAIVLVR